MPIYEYTCLSCGKSFSLLQKVGSTEKDTTCPHCGASEVKKMMSAFSCSVGFSGSSGGGFSAPT